MGGFGFRCFKGFRAFRALGGFRGLGFRVYGLGFRALRDKGLGLRV